MLTIPNWIGENEKGGAWLVEWTCCQFWQDLSPHSVYTVQLIWVIMIRDKDEVIYNMNGVGKSQEYIEIRNKRKIKKGR